jgi:hypothetical protein
LSMVGGLAPSMPALGFTDLRLRVRQRKDGIIIRCQGFVRRTRTIRAGWIRRRWQRCWLYQLADEKRETRAPAACFRGPRCRDPPKRAANADPPRLFGWRSLCRLPSISDASCRRLGTAEWFQNHRPLVAPRSP